MKITDKSSITLGLIIGIATVLTPACGSFKAIIIGQAAHAEAINTLKQRQDSLEAVYQADAKKILEALGDLNGQLKQLKRGKNGQ